MAEEKKEFGKWRSFLWPIHSYELKKIVPMFLMFFFILFNYTILRDTKDSLVIPASGAETAPKDSFCGSPSDGRLRAFRHRGSLPHPF